MMPVLSFFGILKIDGQRQIALTSHLVSIFFEVYLKGAPRLGLKNLSRDAEIDFAP